MTKAPEPTAMILSAGFATRLGPAAMTGKAALRLTDAPVLSLQLETLVANGYKRVILVVRPEHLTFVRPTLQRYSDAIGLQWSVVTQTSADGPGAAFIRAIEASELTGPVLLQLGDTLVKEIPDYGLTDWVGVATAPTHRRWCCVDLDEDNLITDLRDEAPESYRSTQVAVGLYHIACVQVLGADVPLDVQAGGPEFELSQVLRAYSRVRPLRALPVKSWLDVGDMRGLAMASADKLAPSPAS